MRYPSWPPEGISESDADAFARGLRALPADPGRVRAVLRRSFRLGFRLAAWHVDADWASLPRAGGRRGGGCIVVPAPHRAWLEPFLLHATWPSDGARTVWLADGRTASRSRWRRWLLPRFGVIPITGRPGDVESYAAQAAAALERGLALVVFPEVGPPSPPDRTRRISPGFAYLATRAGAPVVPVVIAGTHHIVRGSSFSLTSLPPIDPGAPVSGPADPALRQRAHALRDAYADAVAGVLPTRNAATDARRPSRDRWRWLGTLFD